MIDLERLRDTAAGRPFAFVVGWPIRHSLSPALHGHWLARHRLDGLYGRLALEPTAPGLDALADFLRATPNARGCNLTLPHKVAFLSRVDRVEPLAARMGAVNTIVRHADGSLEGRNTDGYGFLEALRQGAPGWRPKTPALLLGAGGAARGIAVTLLEAGCPELRIANRTRATAEKLRDDLVAAGVSTGITVIDWEDRGGALAGAGLLVNATSLGMKGGLPLDMPLDALSAEGVVNDIVYVPLETDLLRNAGARGLTAVDGLGMLLHQGRPGFETWFNQPVAVDAALRAAVLAARETS